MSKTHAMSIGAGLVIGSLVFGAHDAKALFGAGDTVFDPTNYAAIGAMQAAVTRVIGTMQDAVVNTIQNQITSLGGLLDDKLTAGFTQMSNYSKASVSAQRQIADGSNTAMAQVQKSFRNAEIRDEHTLSPEACLSLGAQGTVAVSAGQAWKVAAVINSITDRRVQGAPQTPAHEGEGQSAAALTQLHLARYCSENEAAVGLCSVDITKANLDQDASSLFGNASYDPNGGVDAANDFGTNVLEPVTPAASRGAALTSMEGQDAEARRRAYNAKMSLARNVVDDVIASRTNSVNLTDQAKQEMTNQGLTPTDQSSWYNALALDINRRAGGVEYAASLQAMTPKSVDVEVAQELATTNLLLLKLIALDQQTAVVHAANLAIQAQAELTPVASMPTANIASQ